MEVQEDCEWLRRQETVESQKGHDSRTRRFHDGTDQSISTPPGVDKNFPPRFVDLCPEGRCFFRNCTGETGVGEYGESRGPAEEPAGLGIAWELLSSRPLGGVLVARETRWVLRGVDRRLRVTIDERKFRPHLCSICNSHITFAQGSA